MKLAAKLKKVVEQFYECDQDGEEDVQFDCECENPENCECEPADLDMYEDGNRVASLSKEVKKIKIERKNNAEALKAVHLAREKVERGTQYDKLTDQRYALMDKQSAIIDKQTKKEDELRAEREKSRKKAK